MPNFIDTLAKCLPQPVISIYIAGCLAALLPTNASATTVVALMDYRHHRIVLAADSRLVFRDVTKLGIKEIVEPPICKLVAQPYCAAAFAGFTADTKTGFNLFTSASELCKKPGSLRNHADALLKRVRKALRKIIAGARRIDPVFYKHWLATGNPIFTGLFAGLENGHLSYYELAYLADKNGNLLRPYGKGIIDVALHNTPYALLGQSTEITKYMQANPHWDSGDAVKIAEQFVASEIQAHPDTVAPPISVFQIDKGGNHWITRGACGPAT
ncbi:MAG: hypothetical protein JO189_28545 [Deltaproteobacteria bacterium]|nr:hypothetical protein [Deltaproteobacteria bacterium]